MIKNVYNKEVTDEIINRIELLNSDSQRLWGSMDVAQMLAHCNIAYLYTFTPEQFAKPNFLMAFVLKSLVKKKVVSQDEYKQNQRTSPTFIIADKRDFEIEKVILINHIEKVQRLGEAYFEGKENFSFGPLTAQEWNNMFYKHLNHHLKQFGV